MMDFKLNFWGNMDQVCADGHWYWWSATIRPIMALQMWGEYVGRLFINVVTYCYCSGEWILEFDLPCMRRANQLVLMKAVNQSLRQSVRDLSRTGHGRAYWLSAVSQDADQTVAKIIFLLFTHSVFVWIYEHVMWLFCSEATTKKNPPKRVKSMCWWRSCDVWKLQNNKWTMQRAGFHICCFQK